jgi:DNA-binding IclR family transcriptional regulator|tara:strand:+ start:345 stop:491 length:147 start_codon:yes stop_codon:yes gene_type:complete
MPGLQPIRAIERGVSVMRALEELGAARLHKSTGLHRTTLLRILLTLEQ